MKLVSVGLLTAFLSVIFLLNCCTPANKAEISDVDRLYKEYELQSSPEKAEIYLDSLDSFIRTNIKDKEKVKSHLERGIEISMKEGMVSRSPGYLLPLLRLFPSHENKIERLLSLGDVMYALQKRHASSIIFKELAIKYPENSEVQAKASLIDSVTAMSPDYLGSLFEQILIDPGEMGVNRAASLKYVDGVEAMALTSPEKESIGDHLYKAAEVARSMRTFPKAMSLYDWLIEDYPQHEKAPTALFIKGFILEQDYERVEEAKEIYMKFLSQYPNHEMAESAKFLLDNIGKSDEQILKEIEEKKNAQ